MVQANDFDSVCPHWIHFQIMNVLKHSTVCCAGESLWQPHSEPFKLKAFLWAVHVVWSIQVPRRSTLPLKWSAPLPSLSSSIIWQWPHLYTCLMELRLANRDPLPLQHDPSTENAQARWRLYHWVSCLLWNTAHRQLCSSVLSSPASLSSHLPFSFSFPGLFMGFFFHWIMILKVIVLHWFFFFARGVHVCTHSHLCACEAQVSVLV